jgi:hypothetical protein
VCPAACLDTKHAGIGLALHHAVVACVAGFAGPVFVGALLQRTGSFASVSAWGRGTVRVGDLDGGKRPPSVLLLSETKYMAKLETMGLRPPAAIVSVWSITRAGIWVSCQHVMFAHTLHACSSST